MLQQKMIKEQQKLLNKISQLKSQLSKYPEGTLLCARNGKHYKWYQSADGQPSYIPKKNQNLAEQLAAKKYLSLLLKDLLQEEKAISFYLRHCPTDSGNAEKLLTEPSGFQELLAPFFTPSSTELASWASMDYERNRKYPEQLIHKTSSGIYVRSKSEVLIDMFLYRNRIPFRYECALQLGDVTLFPDFTIRHPRTGDTYYWEHFGLMDELAYQKNTFSKLQLYSSHGIIPSIRLITTYETKEHPLSSDDIEKIIEHYFL